MPHRPPTPAPLDGVRVVDLTTLVSGALVLLAVSDPQLAGLRRALGDASLPSDSRFAITEGRMARSPALGERVGRAVADLETAEIILRLRDEGVPAAPVLNPESLQADPHVRATRLRVETQHPASGRVRLPRPVAKLGAEQETRPTPTLGQHTIEILAELGMSQADLAAGETSGRDARESE